MHRKLTPFLTSLVAGALLAACGGGGSGDNQGRSDPSALQGAWSGIEADGTTLNRLSIQVDANGAIQALTVNGTASGIRGAFVPRGGGLFDLNLSDGTSMACLLAPGGQYLSYVQSAVKYGTFQRGGSGQISNYNDTYLRGRILRGTGFQTGALQPAPTARTNATLAIDGSMLPSGGTDAGTTYAPDNASTPMTIVRNDFPVWNGPYQEDGVDMAAGLVGSPDGRFVTIVGCPIGPAAQCTWLALEIE